MRKKLLVLFSISVSAGTLYFTYSKLKHYLIKKLIRTWSDEMIRRGRELDPAKQEYLSGELEKLYPWEVQLLANYTAKIIARASEKEKAPLVAKIRAKKIADRANLRAVTVIIENR
jgi:hypothetical protein